MTAPPNEHPSDLRLDALHLGELSPAQEASVRDHLSGCELCARRMTLRSAAAFSALDPERMVTRLVHSVPARRRSWLSPPWMRRLLVPATACAAAAVVLLVLASERSRPGDHGTAGVESVRPKGGEVALRVFREQNGSGVERRSGDTFHGGDRVRFRVDAPRLDLSPYIVILGVEESGKRSVYYPAAPTDGPVLAARPEVRADGALAGAVELDDYVGDEWLYAVACAHRFAAADVVVVVPGAAPRVPDACRWRWFHLVKK